MRGLSGRTPGYIDDDIYRKYAVTVPYFAKRNSLLFEVRSEKLKRQPGEICFPGGRIEDGETPQQAALRELCEELCLKKENTELIAPLDLLVTPYYTIVHPFLTEIKDYAGAFSTDEVKEVFEVPVAFFLETEPSVHYNEVITQPKGNDYPFDLLIGGKNYPWGKATYPVLFYQYKDWVIWGMTAKMVHNFITLYKESGQSHS